MSSTMIFPPDNSLVDAKLTSQQIIAIRDWLEESFGISPTIYNALTAQNIAIDQSGNSQSLFQLKDT